ncbi:MAG: putative FAD-dependent dehydrogenase [Pseudohongiellaceae bacterium]|jgi:uncharacterized FAD-dependent dehydrogenase
MLRFDSFDPHERLRAVIHSLRGRGPNMTFVIQDLRVPLDREGVSAVDLAARRLGVRVEGAKVLRKSLDARAGKDPVFIYSLRVEVAPDVEKRLREGPRGKSLRAESPPPQWPDQPDLERPHMPGRPVVVGSGPAGLFATWQLLRSGHKPLLLERGPDVTTRGKSWYSFLRGGAFDPECNLLFGEGGAGTFSDGKLTTRIKDPRVSTVLSLLVEHGAPESCLWEGKPHVGSNALPAIVRSLRRGLVDAGAEVRFSTRVDDLVVADDRVVGVRCAERPEAAGAVLLAIGHSARDTYAMLMDRGVAMSAKPFQMGLRVEHPQSLINEAQYGASCGHPALPVAEYSLVSRDKSGQRSDVYSFCMCPGGEILPATERDGVLCVNGASPRARDGHFANSGLVVTVPPDEFSHSPQAGLALQERLETRAFALGGGGFGAPGQRVVDFLAGRLSETLAPTSYPLAVRSAQLSEVLPEGATAGLIAALKAFEKRLPGYAGTEAMLVGPESRSSAPLRMDRDKDSYESLSHPGLYPLGEGAGWAGGIMSAAVDGLRAAEAIHQRYRPALLSAS